jgi:hypothetical protein
MWVNYAGNVTSGGPGDLRVLPLLTIRKASVGAMANNVYLLTCARTGAQLLIDAADDPERIVSLLDVYGDDTWIYPGHGADTTLGAERPHLQQWRERGW